MLGRKEVERLHSNATVSIGCGLEQWHSPEVIAELCRVYLAVLDAPVCEYEGEMHGTQPCWAAPYEYDGPEVGQRVRIVPDAA